MNSALADAQALSTMLTVEGFLLATVSLAATLGTPGRRRPAAMPIKPASLALGAAGVSALVGSAGIAAWFGLYGQGEILPFRQWWIAAIALVALVAQPVVAVVLALGTRSKA